MRGPAYRFTPVANADLDEIWESIARENRDAADRLILEIYERVKLLAKFPDAGHSRKDLAGARPLLFFPVGKYMIAYKSDSDPLVVVRILHAARNLSAVLGEDVADE